MAEVALAAVGSSACVVQLGDAALRMCRSISSFIGELKDAKHDIRHLRSTLDDTGSLMKSLIAYIREFQSAASGSIEHEVLPDVVINSVQQFDEIVQSLRKRLPPNLSPSFAQRFRFVFDKRKIRSATARLEGCKANVSLALNIMSCQNDIKIRKELGNIRNDSETAATGQKAAEETLTQISQLVTTIQGMSQYQLRALPILERVGRSTSDISAQLQSTLTLLQGQGLRSQPARSERTFTAIDEDSLARIVRICVTQTLETVAPGAYHEKFFRATPAYASTSTCDIAEAINTGSNTIGLSSQPFESPLQRWGKRKESRMVKLFRTYKEIYTKWVTINLCVTGLRHLQTNTYDSTPCFSVRVLVIPQRLVSLGVSLFYTNIPDDIGYYNICPRILTFSVVPYSTPIWDVTMHDDVDELRHMIMDHELGLRDSNCTGFNLFSCALPLTSLKCCRCLFQETGVSKALIHDLLGYDDLPRFLHTCLCNRPRHLSLAPEVHLLALELDLNREITHPKGAGIWLSLWLDQTHTGLPISKEQIQVIEICQQSNAERTPLSWVFKHDCSVLWVHQIIFDLELSLKTGGNPNDPSYDEGVPLELSMEYLATYLATPYSKFFDLKETENETAGDQIYGVALRVLVLLVDAGADIFFIREIGGQLQSITDLALEKGLKQLWEEALRACGHNPSQVYEEDMRNHIVYKRLRLAERSGVDVESMKNLSTSGLRRRARRFPT
ncbi:hypothetical protein F5Y04DRAFT_168358 [Hypomontagnella monticulosa]|nr:hypothetical protein F5Y04DRAFT_168358 [Hypomontagnella monticulosa]